MSCDHLAEHAIATLGASLSSEAREHLQAVYDLPATLQAGEDGPALRRAARGLVLRLKASGATIPAHLDVDNPRSRAAIRLGRLALALAGNWGGSPVAAPAPKEPPTAQPDDREAVALMRNLAVSAARLAFRERLAAGERVPVAEALAYLQQQRQRQPALVSSMWAAVAEEVEPGERDAFAADWEAALGPLNSAQEQGDPPAITATPDIKVTSERLSLDLAVPDGPPGAAHAGLSYHGRRGYRFDALRQRGIREAVVVESLLVYEGFRGRGYGERLLQEAIRRAHAEGLPLALKATPLPDGSSYNRAELIAWYQKRGGQLLTEGGQWMVWPVPPAVTVNAAHAPQKADPAFNDEYGHHDPDKYRAAATAWAEHHLSLMERGGEQSEQAYQTVVRELEANSSALYAISSERVTSLAYELQKRSRSGSRPAFYNDLVDRVTTHWTSDWSDRSESQKRSAWDAWAAGGEVRYDSPDLTESGRRDIIELAISESFE